MVFAPGVRFGPYEVTSILGTGGMGQVYLARDARLDRNVALKVLPPALTVDADRLFRFKREALVLASLNHPNIAAIYGLEERRSSDGEPPIDALVLELVEGPTLAERIAAGPLPPDEASAIAMQIAAALEAAHERGIVHRDLKPANIKVRPDGTVKVLDFGLAKAWEPQPSEHVDVSTPPTFTSPAMTGAGIILGTAAYMSPEQARGATVDKRTDVWAFGCVLFEMLAGRHVFGGAGTVSDAIAAVLKSEPDWQALPANTPPHIRSLLKRCLQKDARHRLRDIGDAGLLLGDTLSISASAGPQQPAALPPDRPRWIRWTAVTGWMLAAILAIVNTAWIAGGFRSVRSSPPAPLRLALPLASQAMAMNENWRRSFALSSDGTRFVYLGRDSTGSSLYLQDLVSGELKRLAATTAADVPAFSPDGRAIAFTSGSTIKVLRLDGGLPRDVARLEQSRHWAWSGLDHIVLAGPAGLMRVPLNGGPPEVVAKPAPGEAVFSSAFALPGGAYLVSVRTTRSTDDRSRVAVVVPGQAEHLVLAERGGSPTFVPGSEPGFGHVVYGEAGRLMALPFDAARRIVKGGAVPIVENVAMRPNGDLADYTVSSTGTLVFRDGSLHELVSIDRGSGAVRPLSANLRRFALPRLSSDGKRLAMEIQDSPHQIWMLDIERDVLVPITTESTGSHNFAWSPDGSSILYTIHVTPPQLGWIRTNGSGNAERLTVTSDSRVMVHGWSRDGRLALRFEGPPNDTIMTLRLDGAAPPRVAGAPVRIAEGIPGSFSPDGLWLAYCDCGSSGDRAPNVFIQHLESGTRHQVSTDGGTEPAWASSGRELFFRAGPKMMAAQLAFDGTSVRIGRPQTVFEGDYLEWSGANYDVTSDGGQFVMVRTANTNTRTFSVRLNWTTELERLAPIQP
jgi:eukaryotic-like serine/threonine-protein kinase